MVRCKAHRADNVGPCEYSKGALRALSEATGAYWGVREDC
jgi:hypothetical protein